MITQGLQLPIKTQRLYITEFDESMAEVLHLNSLDNDNRRFVPDEVFETVDIALKKIVWFRSLYAQKNEPLVYVQAIPYKKGWEIGYHITKNYTGSGYATEALHAFLIPVMKKLGISAICGICLADNAASRRVLEKCGFTLVFDGNGNYQGKKQHIYRYQYICS